MTIRVRNWDRYKLAKGTRADGSLRWVPAYATLLEDDEFKGRGGWNRLGLWIAILLQAGRRINNLPATDAWWRSQFGSHGPQIRDRFLASNHLEQLNNEGTVMPWQRPASVPPAPRQDTSSAPPGQTGNGSIKQIADYRKNTEDTQGPPEKSRAEKTLEPHYVGGELERLDVAAYLDVMADRLAERRTSNG